MSISKYFYSNFGMLQRLMLSGPAILQSQPSRSGHFGWTRFLQLKNTGLPE